MPLGIVYPVLAISGTLVPDHVFAVHADSEGGGDAPTPALTPGGNIRGWRRMPA